MLENGYIFAHRSLVKWGWYKDIPTCKLWLHLLLCANYEPCEFMGDTIGAGELATSYSSLADGSGLTVKQVRNALDKLKKTGEIKIRTNRHYSVIHIEKYNEYQIQFRENRADKGQVESVDTQLFSGLYDENRADKGQTKGRQMALRGHSEGTQRATMEESKKARKQEYTPPTPPAGDFTGGTAPAYRPDWFDRFWNLYPRKISKKPAVEAWDKLRPSRELCDKMAKAIRRQMKSKQWQDQNLIPNPAKWLNEARWEDEVDDADPNHDSWYI